MAMSLRSRPAQRGFSLVGSLSALAFMAVVAVVVVPTIVRAVAGRIHGASGAWDRAGAAILQSLEHPAALIPAAHAEPTPWVDEGMPVPRATYPAYPPPICRVPPLPLRSCWNRRPCPWPRLRSAL